MYAQDHSINPEHHMPEMEEMIFQHLIKIERNGNSRNGDE